MHITGKVQSIMQLYKDQNVTAKSNTTVRKTAMGKDEVILSSKGQEFSQIYQSIKAMPEVRQDKVQELQGKIEAGTYHINTKDVAGKILDQIGADRQ